MVTCAREGCSKRVRARGLCENHYRESLRRARGVGGVEPKDGAVWKVRVQVPNGSKSFYYSERDAAYRKALAARDDGTLRYFGHYLFSENVTI